MRKYQVERRKKTKSNKTHRNGGTYGKNCAKEDYARSLLKCPQYIHIFASISSWSSTKLYTLFIIYFDIYFPLNIMCFLFTAADFSLRMLFFVFGTWQKITFKNVNLYISYITRTKYMRIYTNNHLAVAHYILQFELFWMDGNKEKQTFHERLKTYESSYITFITNKPAICTNCQVKK